MDLLAKKGLDKDIDIHMALGRVELEEDLIKEWQAGWETEDQGRQYFTVQPDRTRKCFCNILSHRDAVKLCRLRLGHCGLN